MGTGFLTSLFGTGRERQLKKIIPLVDEINRHFDHYRQTLSDDELPRITEEFRQRLSAGETLDDILPEAFGLVKDACRRLMGKRWDVVGQPTEWDMVPYDVQLIGAVVQHQGKITEMATGEGKTLVATMPLYLNSLDGEGSHLITVNDYLAQRDSEWMGGIYSALGVTVGCILNPMLVSQIDDLLKSEMAEDNYEAGRLLLKGYHALPKHKRLMKLLAETGNKSLMRQVENDYLRDKRLHELDEELLYVIDEKHHTIDLTEEGRELLARKEGTGTDLFLLPDLAEESHRIESRDDLSDDEKLRQKDELQSTYAERSERIHNISQLLRAYSLYEKDVEYVVQDGKVLIVDEFTGRLMPGRRYSDGLHQSIEAKEGVKVEGETQTVATITLQNYFRLYDKLAGMTGTAETEEAEFWDIYKLEVVVIPTNESVRRSDHDDIIFKTKREKYNAIIDEISELHSDNLPVLVGTTSVEVSETLSRMLRRKNIPHNVLNAKHHQSEAEIVKYAGQPGALTIATNMAGRGTDIKLGQGVVRWEGKERDRDASEGGLQILGTERHESRRIDQQLRGRSGRQGDPGASIFYLSLEDDLMRLFGSERLASIMDRLGVKEGEVITHPLVTKSIEKAQKRVEAYNFSIRKHLLEYDDVMNQQREVVYGRRRTILFDEDIHRVMEEIVAEYLDCLLENYTDEHATPDLWNQDQIGQQLRRNLQIDPPPRDEWGRISEPDDWQKYLLEQALEAFDRRRELYSKERFDPFVRWVALRTVDEKWKDHLYDMDRLKEGVGLRAYGQKDPLIEYKREGFEMFSAMLDSTNEEILRIIYNQVIQEPRERRPVKAPRLSFVHAEATAQVGGDGEETQPQPGRSAPKRQPVRVGPTVGRNDPCPCGSGKKYKKCCGA